MDDTDLIYVCGGDTYLMLEVWKNTGFDKKLKEVYDKDSAVLCGSSAGGMCWFATGYSDCSRKKTNGHSNGFLDCLGIYDMAFCPHAGSRGADFEEDLPETGLVGLEMEDETAFVDNNGEIVVKYIKRRIKFVVTLAYHELIQHKYFLLLLRLLI